MEEFAVVTACADQDAVLEIERRTACGLCGQKRGCGNATWGKLLGHQQKPFVAENPIGASVGDSVVVGIDQHVLMRTMLFLYLTPLFFMIVLAVLADFLQDSQFYVMLSALLGLLLGFIVMKKYLLNDAGLKSSGKARYKAVILRFSDVGTSCSSAEKIDHKLER